MSAERLFAYDWWVYWLICVGVLSLVMLCVFVSLYVCHYVVDQKAKRIAQKLAQTPHLQLAHKPEQQVSQLGPKVVQEAVRVTSDGYETQKLQTAPSPEKDQAKSFVQSALGMASGAVEKTDDLGETQGSGELQVLQDDRRGYVAVRSEITQPTTEQTEGELGTLQARRRLDIWRVNR